MKTEISRNSYQPDRHYSGVYQQQGRMLTDADWNEQVDIGKQRQDEVLRDAIGSGSPKDGGIIGSKNQLQWGTVYVDGIRGELRPSHGNMDTPFQFDQQADIPLVTSAMAMSDMAMPDMAIDAATSAITMPIADDVLFLDVWERAVTGIEDSELVDPALAGADTCTRMQTMTQLKWCAAGDMPDFQGTKSELTVSASAGFTGSASNYLFRLEVHASTAENIVLKWSRENAAEQYKRSKADEILPDDFTQGAWAYEYFTGKSEKFSGFLGKVDVPSDAISELDPTPDRIPAAGKDSYIRRWDGYCKIDKANITKAVDLGKSVAVSQIAGILTVKLDDFTLKVSGLDQALAGGYWQFPVRKDAAVDAPLPTNLDPVGIIHRYLNLGKYKGDGRLVLSPELAGGAMSFPPLQEMHDTFVNVDGDTMTGKLNIENYLYVQGNIGAGFKSPLARLAVNGGLHVGGSSNPGNKNLQVDGDSNALGNASVGKNLTVSGNMLGKSDFMVNGNATIGKDLTISGNLTVDGDTTTVNASEVEIEDNILRVNKYSARATPLPKNGGLEVFRGGKVPNGQLIWNESADQWMAGVAGSLKELAYGPKWEKLTNGSDAAGLHRHSKLVSPDGSSDPALSVDNNGKIGIGTATPKSRLDIAGSQWDLSTTEGDFRVGNANYRLKVGVAVTGAGKGDVRLRAHGGTNRLILGGGTSDTLTVALANVGIGTITPTEKLDVRGNVKAALFIGDGSQLTGIAAGKWTNAVDAGKIHYSGGNVGIGTNRPLSALHVKEDCRVEGRLYGAVEGPGGEDYRIANGQTEGKTTQRTQWKKLSANAIYVDVDTSSAKFAVTPQYFFNLLGDEGHHTVMGVGCVSNPTKTGFRVYLHRESGLTVDDANSKRWYIQWTAVGHDRRTGFVFHPTLSASDLSTLQTKQENALSVYHTQLTGRITLLNNVNATISNSTTGLAAIRIKANNAFDKGVNALTRANNAFDKGNSAFDKATSLETRATTLETKTNTLGNAINTNANALAGIKSVNNVAKIDSSFSLRQGRTAQLSQFNFTLP